MAPLAPRAHRLLSAWLCRRGFTLKLAPHGCDEVDWHARTVSVNTRQRQPLIGALHECGHVLVHQARRRRPRTRVAGATLKEWETSGGGERFRSKREGLQIVEEELAAWARGLRLAQRLRIRVPAKAYRRHATVYSMGYVRALALTP